MAKFSSLLIGLTIISSSTSQAQDLKCSAVEADAAVERYYFAKDAVKVELGWNVVISLKLGNVVLARSAFCDHVNIENSFVLVEVRDRRRYMEDTMAKAKASVKPLIFERTPLFKLTPAQWNELKASLTQDKMSLPAAN